ncbi:dihydroneopterin aldolase [cf. Phormidesmis sp. LEGE 11477]|uniref:dihydroneopterin aldolase n=1 Tax=cf. Phormidesmis sp. LEGE 11477 TaxID=1828680 RepID=UPI00188116A7|nr:dihydroneopterin aldolase [cf. Phormidesmis sp. LEGE 11477]MBE9060768.1 dihydroneopterin aldolase [cf. Phormidesmis sp. LEGE 11477]
MDIIHINDIKAFGYLGVLPEENVLGQWFHVDLKIFIDLSKAGKTDALEDTHSYVEIVQETKRLIQTKQYKLIESLADAVATYALSSDQRIQKINVKVTKPTPPIPNFDGTVAVEISREQSTMA